MVFWSVSKKHKMENTKSKGFGDTVEKFTKATGIKSVVEWVSDATGTDCGCEERKEWLNDVWSYKE